MIKWKVCGMRDEENLREVGKLSPDYIGLIFYDKSSRNAEGIAPETVSVLPESIIRTGVFVNASLNFILEKTQKYALGLLQLHGKESPEFCKQIQQKLHTLNLGHIKISKAFSVNEQFDFETCKPYLPYCDYFLFDTKGKYYGGNGEAFDWKILQKYPFTKPFFLSGGIGPNDAEKVLQTVHLEHLHAIDINSKFELSPANKDAVKIADFIGKIHKN